MSVQVEVEPVRPRGHQRLEPRRAGRELRTDRVGVDEEPLPQVAPDRVLPLGLGESSHRVEVVHLDPIEVVLGLRIDHPEHRVGVGGARDVRDPPVVAGDRHCGGARLPPGDLVARRARGCATGEEGCNECGDERSGQEAHEAQQTGHWRSRERSRMVRAGHFRNVRSVGPLRNLLPTRDRDHRRRAAH